MRQLAEDVARLPEVCEVAELSTATVLKAMGFPERRLLLEPAALAEEFRGNPQLMAKWLARSHDQRIVGGWGIEQEPGKYRVQNFARPQDSLRFEDGPLAAAVFVVRYVGFICDVLGRR